MKMKFRPEAVAHVRAVHGGANATVPGRPLLDFSSNMTPAGIPPQVGRMRPDPGSVYDYPDPQCRNLIRRLARYVRLAAAHLVAGNGAVEIIYDFCRIMPRATRVLVSAPTFGEYEAASRLAGLRVSFLNSMDLHTDLSGLVSAIPERGCVFICNPNNPTGTLLDKSEVLEVADAASARSSLVFVDECFTEMVPRRRESVISHVRSRDNLVVLRSLTKSFGLAGLRIGYAAAPVHVASLLARVQVPWSVNAVAQKAGLAALDSPGHINRTRKIISKEYEFLYNTINKIPGMRCYESAANFILIRTRRDSARLQRDLMRCGILVRDCRSFRNLDCHHIRIAVRDHHDNLLLVRALREAS